MTGALYKYHSREISRCTTVHTWSQVHLSALPRIVSLPRYSATMPSSSFSSSPAGNLPLPETAAGTELTSGVARDGISIPDSLLRPRSERLRWLKTWRDPDTSRYNRESILQNTFFRALRFDNLDYDRIETEVQRLVSIANVSRGFCAKCRHLFDHWPLLSGPDSEDVAVVGRLVDTWEIEAAARARCKCCAFFFFNTGSNQNLFWTSFARWRGNSMISEMKGLRRCLYRIMKRPRINSSG